MAQAQKSSTTRKRSKNSSSGSRAKSTRAKSSTAKSSAQKAQASVNGKSTLGSVGGSVVSGAKDAAGKVTGVTGKAKTALLAGGAAAAGLAATAAATRMSQRKRKVLGVSIPRRNGRLMSKAPSLKAPTLPKRGGGLRRDTRKVASKVTDAANRADRLGQRVSSVATSVRQVSETAEDAAKKA